MKKLPLLSVALFSVAASAQSPKKRPAPPPPAEAVSAPTPPPAPPAPVVPATEVTDEAPLNALSFGLGFMKPHIDGASVGARTGVHLSYRRQTAPGLSIGVSIDGGIREYSCAQCTGGMATENITTFMLTTHYFFPSTGFYVGLRAGSAQASTEIPVSPSTTIKVSGASFALGVHTGYDYPLARRWKLGVGVSWAYIFEDPKAWTLNIPIYATWLF